MKKQLINFNEKLFVENLLEIVDNQQLSESTKIMKVRFSLLQNLKKTEINKGIVLNRDELTFKDKPKTLVFSESLFNCGHSSGYSISMKYENMKFIYGNCPSSGSASCSHIKLKQNTEYISASVTNLFTNNLTSQGKDFIYQFIKELSKTYPTIKTYVIFLRYWQTEEEKKKDSYSFLDDNPIIIPLNLLHHDLPFTKTYDSFLRTVHSRKEYKIQAYVQDTNLTALMKNELVKYIYTGK